MIRIREPKGPGRGRESGVTKVAAQNQIGFSKSNWLLQIQLASPNPIGCSKSNWLLCKSPKLQRVEIASGGTTGGTEMEGLDQLIR